jgi:hypothetical protein
MLCKVIRKVTLFSFILLTKAIAGFGIRVGSLHTPGNNKHKQPELRISKESTNEAKRLPYRALDTMLPKDPYCVSLQSRLRPRRDALPRNPVPPGHRLEVLKANVVSNRPVKSVPDLTTTSHDTITRFPGLHHRAARSGDSLTCVRRAVVSGQYMRAVADCPPSPHRDFFRLLNCRGLLRRVAAGRLQMKPIHLLISAF